MILIFRGFFIFFLLMGAARAQIHEAWSYGFSVERHSFETGSSFGYKGFSEVVRLGYGFHSDFYFYELSFGPILGPFSFLSSDQVYVDDYGTIVSIIGGGSLASVFSDRRLGGELELGHRSTETKVQRPGSSSRHRLKSFSRSTEWISLSPALSWSVDSPSRTRTKQNLVQADLGEIRVALGATFPLTSHWQTKSRYTDGSADFKEKGSLKGSSIFFKISVTLED